MKLMKKTFLVAAALFCTQAQADAVTLRSHDATYAMKQVHQYNRNGSVIEQAQGVLHYAFRNSCDGWTVEYKSAIRMQLGNGNQSQMEWNYTSWESFDGKRLRFRSRMKQNGQESERLHGEARLEEGAGVVVFAEPNGRRETIPADTRFPTTHLREAFERVNKGEMVFSAPYFDGSGDDLDFEVDTVSLPYKGKKVTQVEETKLPDVPVWNMRLTFFKPDNQASVADTEISARYRADGVATRLLQDFGDLVLKGRLAELSYLDEPTCQ